MNTRFWDCFTNWDEAEAAWDAGCKKIVRDVPLRATPPVLRTAQIPQMKILSWMLRRDRRFRLFRNLFKAPFRYVWRYVTALCKRKPAKSDSVFVYYGIESEEEWKKIASLPSTVVVIGFSYCEKPHECPNGRFSTSCLHDSENPVCRQCFLGKAINALPQKRVEVFIVTTVNYIGERLFEVQKKHKGKDLLFCITACPMSLEAFGNFAEMFKAKGIGVKLSGPVCPTFRAFQYAERGVKPQRTQTPPEAQRRMLDLFRIFRM